MKLFYNAGHLFTYACFFFGFISMISCSNANKPQEIIMKYGDGTVKSRFTEINHKKEGLMTDYYPGGQKMTERMFKNDLQVDKTTAYYESGKVKEVQYYKDGELNGGDTVFYENGNPQFLITFSNGLKDGYVRKWGVDGNIIFEAKYAYEKLVEVKGEKIEPDSVPHQVIYTNGTKVEHATK